LRIARLGALIVAALAATVAPIHAAGEDSTSAPPRITGHRLKLGAPLLYDQIRDDMLAPLRWSGAGTGLHLGWGRTWEKKRVEVDLHYEISSPKESYGHPGIIRTPTLVIEGLHDQWVRPTKRLETGLFWRSRIDAAEFEPWDDAHYYYLTSHMLGLTTALSWKTTRGPVWTAQARLPLVGLLARPAEDRSMTREDWDDGLWDLLSATNRKLELAAPPKYVGCDISLGATWSRRRASPRLEYRVSFEYCGKPRAFVRLVQGVVFTYEFGLGGGR
jgi:hypothetical protein